MDPFIWARASNEGVWSAERILRLYEPWPDQDLIEAPEHTVILGSMASGKTMALRYLSLPVQRLRLAQEDSLPPYIGIYYNILDDLASKFKDVYRESGKFELFSDYFFLALVERSLSSLTNSHGTDAVDNPDFLKKISTLLHLGEPAENISQVLSAIDKMETEVFECIRRFHSLSPEHLERPLFDLPISLRGFSSALKECITRFSHKTVDIYFLIDGFERLTILGWVVASLLKVDNTPAFIVKLGTNRYVNMIGPPYLGAPPSYPRDLRIVPLQFDNLDNYVDFVKRVCRRRLILARETRIGSQLKTEIDELLGQNPSDVEEAQLTSLSSLPADQRLIGSLARLASIEKETGSQEGSLRKFLYYGFPCFAQLSYGNVTPFLQLCSEAFAEAEKRKIDIWSGKAIPSECQGRAAHTVSSQSFIDIGSTAGELGSGLFNFTYHFFEGYSKALLENVGSADKLHCRGLQFNEEELAKVCSVPNTVELLKRGIQEGIVEIDDRLSMELSDMLPSRLRLSGFFAPRFGVSYVSKHYKEYTCDEFTKQINEPAPGRPAGLVKRISEAQPLIPKVPRGFLAIKFSQEDKDNPRSLRNLLKRQFAGELRKVAEEDASPIKDADIFFDADDLPKAPFEERTLNGISLADFCVVEVASPSMNVYLELGEMMARRARFHMFWALDFDPKFMSDKLPKFIQNWPIEPIGYKITDYKERRKLVKAVLRRTGDPSILEKCPWDKEKGCGYVEQKEEPNWVFCFFNHRVDEDLKVFSAFSTAIQDRLGLVPESQLTLTARHVFCDLCRKVRKSTFVVVDISVVSKEQKDKEPQTADQPEATSYERGAALVAGFAYALNKKLLLTFCNGRGKTMAMLKGHPECPWEPGRVGEDLFSVFREFHKNVSLGR